MAGSTLPNKFGIDGRKDCHLKEMEMAVRFLVLVERYLPLNCSGCIYAVFLVTVPSQHVGFHVHHVHCHPHHSHEPHPLHHSWFYPSSKSIQPTETPRCPSRSATKKASFPMVVRQKPRCRFGARTEFSGLLNSGHRLSRGFWFFGLGNHGGFVGYFLYQLMVNWS